MDLLRRVQQARAEKGYNLPQAIQSLPTPSKEISRATIIETKPKKKVLKKYFEEFVQQAIDEEE